MRGRVLYAVAVCILAVLAFGGVVIAQGGGGVADEGAAGPAGTRHAAPPRAGPAVVATEGSTPDGRRYVIRSSRAVAAPGQPADVCLEVSAPNPVPDADVTISGDETCFVAPAGEDQVAYATSEVPAGRGKTARTVYGYVAESATRVSIVGRGRQVVVATKKIPNAPADVYFASLPADDSPEEIVITAEDGHGRALGRTETRFAGPSR